MTGGGTGGHFFPIIAVAQAINEIIDKEKIVGVELYYMSDSPYDERLLFENNIVYKSAWAGKMRTYFSIRNIFDSFKTAIGILSAIWKIFLIYPDVIFGKGGYNSFPALFAAKLLRIPVVIHESDTVPGRVNLWASKFAKKIAISHDGAIDYFPKEKVVITGNPIRKELIQTIKEGAHDFLKLEEGIPVVFITGGSQGSVNINDVVLDILFDLVKNYQVIHQVGQNNFEQIKGRANFILEESIQKDRYKPFAFLNATAMRMVGGVVDLVVSRGGSFIFEIANWGVPGIIIPIPEEVSRDQRQNAFAYARSGAGEVIEEKNLTPTILLSEINRIMQNKSQRDQMSKNALIFGELSKNAASSIAREIINIGLEHEPS